MRKAAKSSESKKKRKAPIILLLSLITFTVLLCGCVTLSIAGLGVAYTSNKEIPLLTESVEQIEQNVIEPGELAKIYQDDLADKVVKVLEGATDEDGMTSEELQLALQEEFGLTPTKENSPSSATFVFGMQVDEEENVDYNIILKGDAKNDSNNNRTGGTLDLSIKFGEEDIYGNADYILDSMEGEDPTYYFKINEAIANDDDSLFEYLKESEFELDIEGKWLELSTLELQDFFEDELGEDFSDLFSTNSEEYRIKLSEEQLDGIEELLRSEELLGEMEWLEGKTFDGNRARCQKITWEREHLEAIIETLDDTDLIEDDEDEIIDGLEELAESTEFITISTCTDRSNNNLYEFSMDAQFVDESSYSDSNIDFNFDIAYSGYGKSEAIELPNEDDSLNLVDVIKDVYEEYENDNPYDYHYDYDYDNYFNSPLNYKYTIYMRSDCPYSENVENYIKEHNELMTMYFVEERYIDNFDYYREEFDTICNQNKEVACEVPLLVVEDLFGQQLVPDAEYIAGDQPIIEYFDKMLEEDNF